MWLIILNYCGQIGLQVNLAGACNEQKRTSYSYKCTDGIATPKILSQKVKCGRITECRERTEDDETRELQFQECMAFSRTHSSRCSLL